MLGVDFHVNDAGGLNEDDDWHGFRRVCSALTISASHLEKYLAAADMILDEAFPDREVRRVDLDLPAQQLAGGINAFGAEQMKQWTDPDVSPRPRLDLWPGQQVAISTPSSWDGGRYRFCIQASGIASSGQRPAHLAIHSGNLDRLLFERDLIVPEDQPEEFVFEVHLPPGKHRFLLTNEVNGPAILSRLVRTSQPFYSLRDGYLPWQMALLDSRGRPNYPCLIVDRVRIEGPVVTPRMQTKRDRFWPETGAGHREIRECLARFQDAAFRRRTTAGERERYLALVTQEMDRGADARTALKTGMLAILVSRDFLFLVEGSRNPGSDDLDDRELASRLSYFLWSSMPDERLLGLAGKGVLHEPEILRGEVRRMLADSRSVRFSADFASQWLKLDRVGQFRPNARLYPEYDLYLQRSMVQESVLFLTTCFETTWHCGNSLTRTGRFLIRDWPVTTKLKSNRTEQPTSFGMSGYNPVITGVVF